jgi:hypothetical protein
MRHPVRWSVRFNGRFVRNLLGHPLLHYVNPLIGRLFASESNDVDDSGGSLPVFIGNLNQGICYAFQKRLCAF